MPGRRKKTSKTTKMADFVKQLNRVAREVKKLDADIRILKRQYSKGNFRML